MPSKQENPKTGEEMEVLVPGLGYKLNLDQNADIMKLISDGSLNRRLIKYFFPGKYTVEQVAAYLHQEMVHYETDMSHPLIDSYESPAESKAHIKKLRGDYLSKFTVPELNRNSILLSWPLDDRDRRLRQLPLGIDTSSKKVDFFTPSGKNRLIIAEPYLKDVMLQTIVATADHSDTFFNNKCNCVSLIVYGEQNQPIARYASTLPTFGDPKLRGVHARRTQPAEYLVKELEYVNTLIEQGVSDGIHRFIILDNIVNAAKDIGPLGIRLLQNVLNAKRPDVSVIATVSSDARDIAIQQTYFQFSFDQTIKQDSIPYHYVAVTRNETSPVYCAFRIGRTWGNPGHDYFYE